MRPIQKRLAVLEAAATPAKTALVVVGMPFLPSDQACDEWQRDYRAQHPEIGAAELVIFLRRFGEVDDIATSYPRRI